MRGVLILSLLACVAAKVLYNGDQVLRFTSEDLATRELLRLVGQQHQLKFWREPERMVGPVDMHVPAHKVTELKQLLRQYGIEYDVMIDDVQEVIDAQVTPRLPQLNLAEFDYNKYHTFQEIDQWVTDYTTAHKKHLTKIKVGVTYQNTTFHAVKISTGGSMKPAFVIDCGIHADEWIGPATCIHVIKNLTEHKGLTTKVGKILESVDFYLIPSANPDGYNYTWTKNRLWRKTRSPTSGGCFGVDPNRNWDVNWSGPGASSDPCNDDYYGPHVWSEANVRSQRDFVNGIPNLHAYIDVHSYSQLWMFPYSYTFKLAEDYHLLSTIANQSVAAIKDVHGKVYTPGPISKTIYIASGSTADYFYVHDKLKCVFAAELRDTGKHGMLLPESEIQPTAEETFAGLMVIADHVMNGSCM
uniref:Carboxypeptidase B n=1 Tax=Ciona intestinalis TaxID=7719 RepID=F7B4M8_CIOIN|nr:carboxypeptidase B [Ciona intestinalis]|eukprot:XP_002125602.1 carboxypeptidase B [Ciona intestinalis]